MITALRAARLFDGASMRGPATVVLDGGLVAGVEERSVDGEIDLGDVTLLPGLIDCHVHLGFACCGTGEASVDRMVADDDSTLLLRMRLAAQRALQGGVTTVRDLGDRSYLSLALREWFRSGTEAGPHIVCAGPPLTSPRGHCWFMGGEVDGDDAIRHAVRERAERGADVVKVMATGGRMTTGSDELTMQFTQDELRTVVDEADRLGLPVTAHAHGGTGVVAAVRAGAGGIEHGGFWTSDGLAHADDADLDDIVKRGVNYSITFGFADTGEPIPPPILTRLAAVKPIFRRLRERGARIVVGSDAGIVDRKPHDVLPRGVVQLGELGFSPLDALTSATSLAADVCGVPKSKGRVASGYDADLLCVGGDPVLDPSALLDVRGVWRAGVRVR